MTDRKREKERERERERARERYRRDVYLAASVFRSCLSQHLPFVCVDHVLRDSLVALTLVAGAGL